MFRNIIFVDLFLIPQFYLLVLIPVVLMSVWASCLSVFTRLLRLTHRLSPSSVTVVCTITNIFMVWLSQFHTERVGPFGRAPRRLRRQHCIYKYVVVEGSREAFFFVSRSLWGPSVLPMSRVLDVVACVGKLRRLRIKRVDIFPESLLWEESPNTTPNSFYYTLLRKILL